MHWLILRKQTSHFQIKAPVKIQYIKKVQFVLSAANLAFVFWCLGAFGAQTNCTSVREKLIRFWTPSLRICSLHYWPKLVTQVFGGSEIDPTELRVFPIMHSKQAFNDVSMIFERHDTLPSMMKWAIQAGWTPLKTFFLVDYLRVFGTTIL